MGNMGNKLYIYCLALCGVSYLNFISILSVFLFLKINYVCFSHVPGHYGVETFGTEKNQLLQIENLIIIGVCVRKLFNYVFN